jgi:hypothetical protein
LRGDCVDEIERIHVRASTIQVLRDLLSAHEKETPGLVQRRRVFARPAETHEKRIASAAFFDRRRMTHPILVVRFAAESRGRHAPPLLVRRDRVVIRERHELVAISLVPVRDHLRKVVAVAPERVGVRVALPPSRAALRQLDGTRRWPISEQRGDEDSDAQ